LPRKFDWQLLTAKQKITATIWNETNGQIKVSRLLGGIIGYESIMKSNKESRQPESKEGIILLKCYLQKVFHIEVGLLFFTVKTLPCHFSPGFLFPDKI
jgi:hypothetical protein